MTSAQNGVKSNLRYSTQQSGNATISITNGRKLANSEIQLEKQHDYENVEKAMPVFRIPSQPDHQISKIRPPNPTDHSASHNDGGKDVESILKMMTSTLEPLTKIAATPRTDIDVQTPNKPYVYANLPPLLRASANICKSSRCFSFRINKFIRIQITTSILEELFSKIFTIFLNLFFDADSDFLMINNEYSNLIRMDRFYILWKK